MSTKSELRAAHLARREALPANRRAENSRLIQEKLSRCDFFQSARKIMTYLPFRGEVDTWPLARGVLEQGKRLFVPRVDGARPLMRVIEIRCLEQDLELRSAGVPRPRAALTAEVAPAELELVLVPGIAWTVRGYRLGFGGGYFDRLLAGRPESMIACGLAFEAQICPELPLDGWDVAVDWLITERRVIQC